MMKKLAVAAVSLLALGASGVASAQISSGSPENSVLVLAIYDTVNDQTYVQNLGITYLDVVQDPTFGTPSVVVNLDSTALSIFGSATNLIWNVTAVGQDLTLPDGDLFGALSTAVSTPPLSNSDFGILDAIRTQYDEMINAANSTSTGMTRFPGGATGDTGSSLSFDQSTFSQRISGQVGFDNSTSVANGMDLWWLSLDAAYVGEAPQLITSAGLTLDLGGNSFITFGDAAAPIPLPAAAWLLMSGLLGMGAVSRRRKVAA